jgi:hypothetical protein
VGLLFQPRWSRQWATVADRADGADVPSDRERVFLVAVEAVLLGDASRFTDLFTPDVCVRGPHVAVDSLASLQRVVGSPEDALTDVAIAVVAVGTVGDTVIGEWRLDATFTRPVLFDDRLLIEPSGGPVELSGASVAEFDGPRIRAFRHYFDDSELLTDVPGVPPHVRWSLDEP